MSSIKKVIKSIIDQAGYGIRNKEFFIPKDLRGQVRNPLFAKYFVHKSNFIINADFKKCILYKRFSCEKRGSNPFVNSVRDYIKNGNISYSGSELEDFYTTCMPENVADLFNLEGKLHDNLVQLPAVFFVPPWENVDMESKKKFREKYIKIENKKRGKELSLRHGRACFGPVSNKLGELEIKTLVKLAKSITKKGYRRGNGHGEDIEAKIMVNGSDYKYLIMDGTHRIAILSALDYKFAPVRVFPTSIPAFIYRKEVDFWPNVRSGLYTRDQALKIFDSIFKGDGNY